MTDSFIFYRSSFDPQKRLDRETRMTILELVIEYALNGEIIESGNPVADAFFETIKPKIDKDNKKCTTMINPSFFTGLFTNK